jgi:hypothetical protein
MALVLPPYFLIVDLLSNVWSINPIVKSENHITPQGDHEYKREKGKKINVVAENKSCFIFDLRTGNPITEGGLYGNKEMCMQ